MTAAHTGLCTYALRTATGEYLYDAETYRRGYDLGSAQLFLWTPEEADGRVAALAEQHRWVLRPDAVRSRP